MSANIFFNSLQYAILIYFVLMNSIYFIFTAVAFFDLLSFDRRSRRRGVGDVLSGSTIRPITIIVPAFNERATIISSIHSMLEVAYPEFEVIVVNDGSEDDTVERLHQAFSLFPVTDTTRPTLKTKRVIRIYRSLDHPNLIVIDKERGGKSDALNAGINVSSYPLFCCVDADSLLNSDALLRIARPFVEDDRIVAAGGIIRVLNGAVVENHRVVRSRAPKNFLHLCQSIEYIRGFLTGRTALARLNSLLIISGAFGLFLKKAVIDAGGYHTGTVCEDMELIVRLHRVGKEKGLNWRAIFVPDPVCWTQVPSDYRSLMRQRDRWQRGLLESLLIHFKMFLNPKYGRAGLLGMPFYFLFEALGPVIELAGYILIPALWFFHLLDVNFAILFFILAVLYNVMLSLLALIVDDLLFQRYDRPTDLILMASAALLEFIGYRQILTVRRTAAFFTILFRRGHWGHVRRTTISDPHSVPTA
jgi:cellulose synthase/poly-beta-1,6-N-acetylglucosamine synthase-like glycosyltransferase